MARLARVLGVLAGLLLVAALVLMYVPNRASAVVDSSPAAGESYRRVDCGTPFRSTRWSSDDGCEGPILGRGGTVVLAGLSSVLCAGVGVGLWVAGQRPGAASGRRVS